MGLLYLFWLLTLAVEAAKWDIYLRAKNAEEFTWFLPWDPNNTARLLKPLHEMPNVAQMLIMHPDQVKLLQQGFQVRKEVSVHPLDFNWNDHLSQSGLGYLMEINGDGKLAITTLSKGRDRKAFLLKLNIVNGLSTNHSMWTVASETFYRSELAIRWAIPVSLEVCVCRLLPYLKTVSDRHAAFWIYRTALGVPSTKKFTMYQVRHQDPAALLNLVEILMDEVDGRKTMIGNIMNNSFDFVAGVCIRHVNQSVFLELYYVQKVGLSFMKRTVDALIGLSQFKKMQLPESGVPIQMQFMVEGSPCSCLDPIEQLMKMTNLEFDFVRLNSTLPSQDYEFVRQDRKFEQVQTLQLYFPYFTKASPIVCMYAIHRYLLPTQLAYDHLAGVKVSINATDMAFIEIQFVGGDKEMMLLRKAIALLATHSLMQSDLKHDFVILPNTILSQPKWSIAMGRRPEDNQFEVLSLLSSSSQLNLFQSPYGMKLNRPMAVIDARVGHEVQVACLLEIPLYLKEADWWKMSKAIIDRSAEWTDEVLGILVRDFSNSYSVIEILVGPTDDLLKLSDLIFQQVMEYAASPIVSDDFSKNPFVVHMPKSASNLWVLGDRGGLRLEGGMCTFNAVRMLLNDDSSGRPGKPVKSDDLMVYNGRKDGCIHRIVTVKDLKGDLGMLSLTKAWVNAVPEEVALRATAEGIQILILSDTFELEPSDLIKAVLYQRQELLFPRRLHVLSSKSQGSLESVLKKEKSMTIELAPAFESTFKFEYHLKGAKSLHFLFELVTKAETCLIQPDGVVRITLEAQADGFRILLESVDLGAKVKVKDMFAIMLRLIQDRCADRDLTLTSEDGIISPDALSSVDCTSQSVESAMPLVKPLSFSSEHRKWSYGRQIGEQKYERISDAKGLLRRHYLGAHHPIYLDHGEMVILLIDEDAVERISSTVKLSSFFGAIPSQNCARKLEMITKAVMESDKSVVAMKQKTLSGEIILEFWFVYEEAQFLEPLVSSLQKSLFSPSIPCLVDSKVLKADVPLASWKAFHQCIASDELYDLNFTMADQDDFLYQLMVKNIIPGYRLIFAPSKAHLEDDPKEYPSVTIPCSDLDSAHSVLIAMNIPALIQHGTSLKRENLVRLEVEWPLNLQNPIQVKLYHLSLHHIDPKVLAFDILYNMAFVRLIDAEFGNEMVPTHPRYNLQLNPLKSGVIEYLMDRDKIAGLIELEAWVIFTAHLDLYQRHRIMRTLMQLLSLPVAAPVFQVSLTKDRLTWKSQATVIADIHAAGALIIRFLRSARIQFSLPAAMSRFAPIMAESLNLLNRPVVTAMPSLPFSGQNGESPESVSGVEVKWSLLLEVDNETTDVVELDRVHLPALLRPFKETPKLSFFAFLAVAIGDLDGYWKFSIMLDDPDPVRLKLILGVLPTEVSTWILQMVISQEGGGYLLHVLYDWSLTRSNVRWLSQQMVARLALNPARFVSLTLKTPVNSSLNLMPPKPPREEAFTLFFELHGMQVYGINGRARVLRSLLDHVLSPAHYQVTVRNAEAKGTSQLRIIKPASISWIKTFLRAHHAQLSSVQVSGKETIFEACFETSLEVKDLLDKAQAIHADLMAHHQDYTPIRRSGEAIAVTKACMWSKGGSQLKVITETIDEYTGAHFSYGLKDIVVYFDPKIKDRSVYLHTRISDTEIVTARMMISQLWSRFNHSPYSAVLVERQAKFIEIHLAISNLNALTAAKCELETAIRSIAPGLKFEPIRFKAFGTLDVDKKIIKGVKPNPQVVSFLNSFTQPTETSPFSTLLLCKGEFVSVETALAHDAQVKRDALMRERERTKESRRAAEEQTHAETMQRLEAERAAKRAADEKAQRDPIRLARLERMRTYEIRPVEEEKDDGELAALASHLAVLSINPIGWVLRLDGQVHPKIISSYEMLWNPLRNPLHTQFLLQRSNQPDTLKHDHYEASIALYNVSNGVDPVVAFWEILKAVFDLQMVVAIECKLRERPEFPLLSQGVRLSLHFDPWVPVKKIGRLIRSISTVPTGEWLLSERLGGRVVPDFSREY